MYQYLDVVSASSKELSYSSWPLSDLLKVGNMCVSRGNEGGACAALSLSLLGFIPLATGSDRRPPGHKAASLTFKLKSYPQLRHSCEGLGELM